MMRLRHVVYLVGILSLIPLAIYMINSYPATTDIPLNADLLMTFSSLDQFTGVAPVGTNAHSVPADAAYVRKRQYGRRGHVQTVCDQNGLGNPATKLEHIAPSDFSRIFVDDKYKILYCEVPKVACTNWKRILLILTGKMNTTDPEDLSASLVHTTYQQKYLRTLDTYKPKQILTKIRHYYKFMFVRNPLERIVSAYKNKFTMKYNTRYPLRYGRKIIKRYRADATQNALQYGDDVRFEEFLEFLLDSRDKFMDVHWRPFYQLCHPCMVQYDFIGKYETLNEDVDFILDELNVKKLFSFPDRTNSAAPRTASIIKDLFANITSEQVHKLWKLYSIDFSMFDYPYPDFTDS